MRESVNERSHGVENPHDRAGHKQHTAKEKYSHGTVKPMQAKEGSTSGEYHAMGVTDFKSEMMEISAGKFGHEGQKQDHARIAPYMMYNDTTDQNGY
jgi:hypothetical protein